MASNRRVPSHLTGEALTVCEVLDEQATRLVLAIEDLRDTVTAQFRQHDTDLRSEIVKLQNAVNQLLGE